MQKWHWPRRWLVVLCCCIISGTVSCQSSSGYLTTFSQAVHNPDGGKWSPNGRWFAAAVEMADGNPLPLLSPNGQLVNTLQLSCDLGGEGRYFAWLSDGRLSCFSQTQTDRLFIMTLNSQGRVSETTGIQLDLTPGVAIADLQWNPHYPWLATIASTSPGSVDNSLYISDIQGQWLAVPQVVNANKLAWSPDGNTLVLTEAKTGVLIFLSVQPTADGKVTVKETRRISAGASDIADVAWSPSGHWLLCRHASYQSEDYLFLVATDGSGKQVQLTSSNTDGQLDFPAWSPDGKRVIVTHIALGGDTLLSLDIERLLKDKGLAV